MKNTLRKLRLQYATLVGIIILTIIVSQIIIQYGINNRQVDTSIINTAGRQRMLNQRLSKMILDLEQDGDVTKPQLDSLLALATQWKSAHYKLIGLTDNFDLDSPNLRTIDSVLNQSTSLIESVHAACVVIFYHPTKNNITKALNICERTESTFLKSMDETIDAYQRHSEDDLTLMKSSLFSLAIIAVMVLLVLFIFLFLPTLATLRRNNNNLVEHSNQLKASNKELEAREEDITVNLEQISLLQQYLEDRERQFRGLVEDASDMIYELDENGRFSYINPMMENHLGYSTHELQDQIYTALIHPDDVSDAVNFYKQQRQGKEETSYLELKIITKAGDAIWVGQNVRMFYNDDRVYKVSVVARDITMLVAAREALKESKEKAEEATKAKANFLSMMSHEIRTPMNAIIGLSTILMRENPRKDQLEHLKLLKFSGENLLTIINDILDFSKIEAGKIQLEKISFDVRELLSNIHRTLKQRAEEKNIEFNITLDEAIPASAKGDPVRIGQVVTNLLSNAIKFTDTGFVSLHVSSTCCDDDLHHIRVEVTDTGIGIEEENLHRIFESFTQAGADTTRKFGGTGLGLSITKLLLNMMDSDIHVKSEKGKGSTFYFELKLEEGDIAGKKTTDTSTEVLEKLALNILVAEDNKVNQIVAANFLERWGGSVDLADNGEEALRKAQSKKYDIILMDLQMPVLNGYEATQRIRSEEDDYFKNIPILALTGEVMPDIQKKALAAGMNDFIVKPFRPEELREKITKHTKEIIPRHRTDYSANLDLYVDGDQSLKRQMGFMIAKNVKEFKPVLSGSILDGSNESLRRALDKLQTTLALINDGELNSLLDDILNVTEAQRPQLNQKVARLESIMNSIVEDFEEVAA